jgi:hypothetical protein
MMLKTTATKKGVADGATINPFVPTVLLKGRRLDSRFQKRLRVLMA